MRLKSSKIFAPPLAWNMRLDVVALLARKLADLGRADGDYWQIRIDRQFLQILGREAVAHVGKRGQPQIGLVDAVQADGFVVVHARKGRFDGAAGGLERCRQKSFDHFPYALRLRIRHLQIDLGELGLAVGAQVFVAEAAHDLKIFVEAGNHQDLFEHLRRLRQGVKRSGLNAAWNQIIARAFRRRPRHEGRFNLEKSLGRKIIADGLGHLVPRLDVELHNFAAQVDVAIFQARFFVGERRVRRQERRQLRLVQDADFARHQFHFAGGNVFVHRVGIAQLHRADHGDDVFVAHGVRPCRARRRRVRG